MQFLPGESNAPDGSLPSDLLEQVTEVADSFAVLGNETRLTLLHALWEADDGRLSYSDLRERVGESTNLSYHLDRLEGSFVRKANGTYELRKVGADLLRTVLGGAVTEDPSVEGVSLADGCPLCGEPVTLGYEAETLSITCTTCDGFGGDGRRDLLRYDVSPAVLAGRTAAEVFEAAQVLYDAELVAMSRGVCPECVGHIDLSVDVCERHEKQDGLCSACRRRDPVQAIYTCQRCRLERRIPVWFTLMNHSTVVGFLDGQAVVNEPVPIQKLSAENGHVVGTITTTVLTVDPYRFRIDLPAGDTTLVVELDEKLDVLSIEREDG